MKLWLLSLAGLWALSSAMAADAVANKESAHRIVFEFVSDDSEQRESLLNNIENVLKALGPAAEIIVVAHGGGLSLLQSPEAAIRRRMEELVKKQVTFAACENTMRRKNVSKESLLPLAKTVDSGVAEVVRKQEAGWAYIKSGH